MLLLDCFLYSAPTSQPCLVTRIDVPAPLASSSSASRSRAPMKVNLAASTSCSSLRRRHSFRSAVQPGGSSVRAVRGRLDARSACHLRPALSRLVPVLLLEWTSHRLRSCSQAGPAGAVRLTGCHGAHVLGPASPALRRFGSCSVSPVDILREAACRAASYTVRPTRRSCARGSPSEPVLRFSVADQAVERAPAQRFPSLLCGAASLLLHRARRCERRKGKERRQDGKCETLRRAAATVSDGRRHGAIAATGCLPTFTGLVSTLSQGARTSQIAQRSEGGCEPEGFASRAALARSFSSLLSSRLAIALRRRRLALDHAARHAERAASRPIRAAVPRQALKGPSPRLSSSLGAASSRLERWGRGLAA